MGCSTSWCKARAYTPAVVVSTVLTCLVGAVLPAPAGGALFVGGLTAAGLLWAGIGEQVAVRALAQARRLTAAERSALAPAVTLLCQRTLVPPKTVLLVQDRVVPMSAAGVGRRCVLISAELVGAVRDRQLPADQAAAVMAHAAGVVRAGMVRSDPVLLFWTIPWQLLQGAAAVVTRAFGGLPLVSLAWRARIVYGGIALAQSIDAGHPAVGVGSAAVIVLTYLVPRWEHAWLDRLQREGDDHVRQVGLAPDLARFLRRCSGPPAMFERIYSLTGPEERPRLAAVSMAEAPIGR